MLTLLVYDNYKHSLYIQKGIKDENLAVNCVSYKELVSSEEQFVGIDGVYINSSDLNVIVGIVTIVKIYKPNCPVVLLMNDTKININDIKKSFGIDGLFYRPFTFSSLVSEMRFFIFKAKDCVERDRYILRDLELDLGAHQVRYKNKQLFLRNKEFSLLHFMMVNKGKVINRNTILENVWDRNSNILTNTVDVHMSLLRKKLLNITGDPFIHTIHCLGYILE